MVPMNKQILEDYIDVCEFIRESEARIRRLDIVERIINRYSNEGDLVFDPFGGLMTVPMTAVKMKRRGYGIELNPDYFRDGVGYLQAAEDEVETPTLFDFMVVDHE